MTINIDFDSGLCNLELIENDIPPHIRDDILSSPLSRCWPTDTIFWIHSKDGCYTVKSGYWLGRIGVVNDLPVPSTDPSAALWKKTMEYRCPPPKCAILFGGPAMEV